MQSIRRIYDSIFTKKLLRSQNVTTDYSSMPSAQEEMERQKKEGRIHLHNFKEKAVEKEIGREAKEHVQHNLHLL